MKKRRVKKEVVRLVLRVLSICVILYFFITVISYGVRIKSLVDNEKKYSNDLITLKENEEKLKTDILKLNDKEYIARYAREHYLYSKDGEFVLKVEDKDKVVDTSDESYDYKYIYYTLSGALGILLLVFVNHRVKKRRKKKKIR